MWKGTFGSLFAGVGGFDAGLEAAGWECRWQVEIDKASQAVLRRRFPGVALYGDVTRVWGAEDGADELQLAERRRSATGPEGRDDGRPALVAGPGDPDGRLEPVDLVCGGFPCTDLSVAGLRAGITGEFVGADRGNIGDRASWTVSGSRSGLFWEIVRLARQLRPRWLLLENVPGLLTSVGGRDFAVVLEALADCGYRRQYRVLDSRFFGVAQRRRRVFIVGHLRPEVPERGAGRTVADDAVGCPLPDRAAPVLFEPAGGERDSAPRGTERAQTAGTPADGAGEDSGRYWDGGDVTATIDASGMSQRMPDKGRFSAVVVPTITARERTSSGHDILRQLVTMFNSADGVDKPAVLAAPETVAHTLTAEGHDASEDGSGRGVPLIDVSGFSRLHGGHSMPYGDVSPTLEAGTGNKAPGVIYGGVQDAKVEKPHAAAIRDGRGERAGDCSVSVELAHTMHAAKGLSEQQIVAYSLGGDVDAEDDDSAAPGRIETTGYQGDDVIPYGSQWPTLPAQRCNNGGGGGALLFDTGTEDCGPDGQGVSSDACASGRDSANTPMSIRRLMPVECERLQGFRDGWTCVCGAYDAVREQMRLAGEPEWERRRIGHLESCRCADSPRYRQMGNAVTRNVGEWLGFRLAEWDRRFTSRGTE